VVAVQLTEVWADVLCTSMVDPLTDATLPLAPPPGRAGAAPATDVSPRTVAALRAAIPTAAARCPISLPQRASLTIVFAFSLVVRVIYSLLSASIGAKLAARLAG
jgi:hypothetical protein